MAKPAEKRNNVDDGETGVRSGEPGGTIPVVDMKLSHDFLVSRIHEAARRWGFFQVINHDVNAETVEDMEKALQGFFVDSSRENKVAVFRNEGNARGYFDNELTKQTRDYKEGFDVGFEGTFDIDGFNQWPSEPREFKQNVQKYLKDVDLLAKRILHLLCESLGIPKNTLDGEFTENTSFLRLNYYPECKDYNVVDENFGNTEPTAEQGVLSINRHTDAGALTVLYHRHTDPASLQVYDRKRQAFFRVKPLPSSFTINIGDALQVWSNEQFKSPIHRVLAHPEKARISVPFFLNPNYASSCQAYVDANKPMYRPFTWGEFRRKRFEGDFANYGQEVQISDWKITT